MALIYLFTDADKYPRFHGNPRELLICPPTPELEALVRPPVDWLTCGDEKETKVSYLHLLEHIRHKAGYGSGSFGITLTTTLRGIPRVDRLWVLDSAFFPKLIKDTP